MTDKALSFEQMINSINPEIHENLKQAIELGRWANGERLTPRQTELCLQAVIAYEDKHLPPEQRLGYIDRSKLSTGSGF